MLKKLLVLFLIVFAWFAGNSQGTDKRENIYNPEFKHKIVHFGFSLGFNTSDFIIRNSGAFYDTSQVKYIYGIENKRQPGLQFGPVSNFHLGKYFDLRVLIDLTFTQRDLTYYLFEPNPNDSSMSYTTHVMKMSSIFLEFPVLLKYKSKRMGNIRVYIIGGLNYKMDLSSGKKIPDSELPKIRLQRDDIYYEGGIGLDLYTPYFKLSPELKFGIGINNVMVPDQTEFTKAIDYLRSNIFMLTFHFE